MGLATEWFWEARVAARGQKTASGCSEELKVLLEVALLAVEVMVGLELAPRVVEDNHKNTMCHEGISPRTRQ